MSWSSVEATARGAACQLREGSGGVIGAPAAEPHDSCHSSITVAALAASDPVSTAMAVMDRLTSASTKFWVHVAALLSVETDDDQLDYLSTISSEGPDDR